jgi:hypothetical protein
VNGQCLLKLPLHSLLAINIVHSKLLDPGGSVPPICPPKADASNMHSMGLQLFSSLLQCEVLTSSSLSSASLRQRLRMSPTAGPPMTRTISAVLPPSSLTGSTCDTWVVSRRRGPAGGGADDGGSTLPMHDSALTAAVRWGW